ncbi:hypothetical protein LBMAG53_08890 [Planctomycetota bacterium]|nr:hypothetical protein LBMAG53_08890 [Planctomycetota bacterium]
MSELPFTELNGKVIVSLPRDLERDDWMTLREQIQRQLIDRGLVHVIIDCSSYAMLPSVAYGAFAGLARDLNRVRGSFRLRRVSENILSVLTRTRLDAVMRVE